MHLKIIFYFWLLGSNRLLPMPTPTWATLWRKCMTFRVLYNATLEPFKSIRHLPMPTPIWPPFTRIPEIFRKPFKATAQPWNWSPISPTHSVIWLIVYKSFAIGRITTPGWKLWWRSWLNSWKRTGCQACILTIPCCTHWRMNSANKLPIGNWKIRFCLQF